MDCMKAINRSELVCNNLALMLCYDNMSVTEFAKKAGVTTVTVEKVLNGGMVSSTILRRMLEVLNCTEPGNLIHDYYDQYKNRPLTLAEARQLRLMTQHDLANATGISTSYVNLIEADLVRMTEKLHTKFAEVLGVRPHKKNTFIYDHV